MTMLQHKTSSPPAPTSQALDTRIRQLTSALEPTAGRQLSISSRLAPTATEREALSKRMHELADALTPANHDTIIRLVGFMRGAFPAMAASEAERAASLRVYASALRSYPEWAIADACRGAVEGRIGDGRYAPTAPVLVAECDRLVAPLRAERARISDILNAEVYHEPDPEEKARVMAAFAEVSRELAASLDMGKASQRGPFQPITLDEATELAGTLAAGIRLSSEALRKFGIGGMA